MCVQVLQLQAKLAQSLVVQRQALKHKVGSVFMCGSVLLCGEGRDVCSGAAVASRADVGHGHAAAERQDDKNVVPRLVKDNIVCLS